jgi:cell division protein FtsB
VIAVGLALLIGWHVVNGKHGLSVWHQMREQDRTLQKQIQDLTEENAAMRKRIEQLKSNPIPRRLRPQRAKSCTTQGRAR